LYSFGKLCNRTHKLMRYIFFIVIIVYTLFNGTKISVFIAIITSILFLISEYWELKNKQNK
ncbi:hypothetical protein, partial [Enterococcus faecalis]|uniref:hypothetical protein n=1 Tax=Enterococcus faecalis TaxID=1351 RepID=UPI0022E3FE80